MKLDDRSLQRRRRFVSLALLLVLPFASATTTLPRSACAADTAQPTPKNDEKRLIGRWVRLDGGYVLELKEVGKDGSLKAAYFNPRSINVAKAAHKRKDGVLTVFVELRDVNYPGSTYNLRYDPDTDRLIGTYFQAVEKQTYSIEFVRAR